VQNLYLKVRTECFLLEIENEARITALSTFIQGILALKTKQQQKNEYKD
jgi:hypothetical protein